MRRLGSVAMSVKESNRGVDEFRMDVGVIAARMLVMERANPGQPKRQ